MFSAGANNVAVQGDVHRTVSLRAFLVPMKGAELVMFGAPVWGAEPVGEARQSSCALLTVAPPEGVQVSLIC